MVYTPQELIIDQRLTDVHLIRDEGCEIIKALDAAGYVILPKTATAAMLEAGPGDPYLDQEVWRKIVAAYLKETGQTWALPA